MDDNIFNFAESVGKDVINIQKSIRPSVLEDELLDTVYNLSGNGTDSTSAWVSMSPLPEDWVTYNTIPQGEYIFEFTTNSETASFSVTFREGNSSSTEVFTRDGDFSNPIKVRVKKPGVGSYSVHGGGAGNVISLRIIQVKTLTSRILKSNEDLNWVTSSGFYNATYNMDNWELQHYPKNVKGLIVVDNYEGSQFAQTFYSRSNISEPYVAYRFGTPSLGWSPWVDMVPQKILDTGLRDLNSLVSPDVGWEVLIDGAGVFAQRIGNVVFLTISSVRNTSGENGYVTLANLPPGMRPNRNQYGNTWRGVRTYFRASGRLDFSGPGSASDYWSFSYVTNDAWPSSLPGIPT